MSSDVTLQWGLALVPELLLLILMLLVLFFNKLKKSASPRDVGMLAAWGAFAILLTTVGLWFYGVPDSQAGLAESMMWGGMIRSDMVTLVFRVIFLSALIITSLLSIDEERLQRGEYYALLISATMGFSLMAASADLIMLYIALETASISSYLLAGFYTDKERSVEAGMKYFVYGAFATGVMLYGMSLLYGLTFQTNIYEIGAMVLGSAASLPAEANGILLLSAVMIFVGFGFKISAVPLHFWTPDVYQGSPTPFTGFLSTASKAAGFAVLFRVFASGAVGVPGEESFWWAMLVAIAIITMTLGNFAAISQTNIKRMLAYSSIAQAGYLLIGVVTFTAQGAGASMFYLLMYTFTNITAFGIIALVAKDAGADEMSDFDGMSRRSPYLALIMLFALLSLSGIPPTAGFFGKFFIFRAAVDQGLWWLALIGLLNAFVALYYYLSVLKHVYLYSTDKEDVPIPVSRPAWIGLWVSLIIIIYLGVFAGPAYEWTQEAASAFYALVG